MAGFLIRYRSPPMFAVLHIQNRLIAVFHEPPKQSEFSLSIKFRSTESIGFNTYQYKTHIL